MDDSLSAELQAISSKRASLKDKLKKRREAIDSILNQTTTATGEQEADAIAAPAAAADSGQNASKLKQDEVASVALEDGLKSNSPPVKKVKPDDVTDSISAKVTEEVRSADESKKNQSITSTTSSSSNHNSGKKRTSKGNEGTSRSGGSTDNEDILSLLSTQSAKEREDRKQRSEILELLNKPTAKEQSLLDTFKSQSGSGVKEFCTHSTKEECMRLSAREKPCEKLHFRKILQQHTDESLGDCSFLNTCFHMDTCKFIHYCVDKDDILTSEQKRMAAAGQKPVVKSRHLLETLKLVPPQWVQCDLRNFDMSVLGKFSVVMADPPWDIHMELPYGTMSDEEMRQLPIPSLQDDGLIFLWVTGRAMELGRECLKLWGYERVDELIWVKTNQLQRIIRTGRTGHWLNHGKEHCLVGLKGNLKLNRGLDCDVIVAEVRATSHKPDEIYGIIERLSPGTRKLELFGRPHNVQPNWITLGNQVDGIVIHDEEVLTNWASIYPNGYEIVKGMVLQPRKEP